MEYPPCENPNCHSYGKPHPNCKCHGMQAGQGLPFAGGGEVPHFCSIANAHHKECEYYAEGGAVPIEQFKAAQEGDIPEGAIPIDKFVSEQSKYGTVGQQATAAVEGLAKGVAGPLATAAENAMGVPGEDIEGRAKANPVTHMASEAAGLIAPAVLSGGETLFSQAGVLSEVAKDVARIAGTKGAAETALKVGVETALFTIGDEISKKINGRPDSIQSALAHTGLSAILGAGVGYPLGKVSELWLSKLGPKAEDFAVNFADRLQQNAHDLTVSGVEEELNGAQKLADMVSEKASDWATKLASGGVGAELGEYTGIPGGKMFGYIFGQKYLKPFMETVMPSIIDPMLSKLPSGEGMKAAFDVINAVAKGDALIDSSAKALFEVGNTEALNAFIPDKEQITALNDHLEELDKDPQKLMEVGGMTGHYLPDHAIALSSMTELATAFLQAQRPREVKPGALDASIKPSKAQKAAFMRTLGLAQQPLSILSKVKNGSISTKDVQDLSRLYPSLFQNIQSKVSAAMMDHVTKEKPVPHVLKTGLSKLLQQPLSFTQTPGALMLAQATYLPVTPPPAQSGEKKKKHTAQMGQSAKMVETSTQSRQRELRD